MTGLLVGLNLGSEDGRKRGLKRDMKRDMKRVSVLGALIVPALELLLAGAQAAEENVTIGGYTVSFDLGDYTGYELEFEEVPYATVDGEEHPSHVCWVRGNGSMMIALTDYGIPVLATSTLTRRAVTSYLEDANCTTVHTYEERIDGLPAILGLGEWPSGEILVCAVYWPDMREVNGTIYAQVDCTIASDAPVEPTESLLNTIHVAIPIGEGEVVGGGEAKGEESAGDEEGVDG